MAPEYDKLSIDDKIKAIKLALRATRAGSERADMQTNFPELKLPNGFGRMQETLDPAKLTFVYESITGLHRRKLDGKSLGHKR